jgi:hypothetical protein
LSHRAATRIFAIQRERGYALAREKMTQLRGRSASLALVAFLVASIGAGGSDGGARECHRGQLDSI